MRDGSGPEISVVVPSYNGALRLPVLMQALADQDFCGSWEVLICLDGSTDNSTEVLSHWSDELPLRVLRGGTRAGVSQALNRGYSAAQGEVIVRCDDDLTPRADFVRRHRDWHRERTDMGVIGPTLDVFPDTKYAMAYGRPTGRRAIERSVQTPPDRRWVHWAANNSIHRDTWLKSGGFNEELFAYGEDSEFGYRIQQLGVDIVIDLNLLAEHRGPATTARRRARRAFVSGASRRARERLHAGAIPSSAPDTATARQQAWGLLSRAVQRRIHSVDDAEYIGEFTDRIIKYLPRPVSGKLVALVVESSAEAGKTVGPSDLTAFYDQKGRDLAEEAFAETRLLEGRA